MSGGGRGPAGLGMGGEKSGQPGEGDPPAPPVPGPRSPVLDHLSPALCVSSANEEIAQVRSKAQAEALAFQASLRKEQTRVQSLEKTVEQKASTRGPGPWVGREGRDPPGLGTCPVAGAGRQSLLALGLLVLGPVVYSRESCRTQGSGPSGRLGQWQWST